MHRIALAEHHRAAPQVDQFGRRQQAFALRARHRGEPWIGLHRGTVGGRQRAPGRLRHGIRSVRGFTRALHCQILDSWTSSAGLQWAANPTETHDERKSEFRPHAGQHAGGLAADRRRIHAVRAGPARPRDGAPEDPAKATTAASRSTATPIRCRPPPARCATGATRSTWSARCCTTSATRSARFNHPDIAAAILKPFVSEENHWMVRTTASSRATTSSTTSASTATCASNFRSHPAFRAHRRVLRALRQPGLRPEGRDPADRGVRADAPAPDGPAEARRIYKAATRTEPTPPDAAHRRHPMNATIASKIRSRQRRGMAAARRPRRLLPPGRAVRLERPGLHPHQRPRARAPSTIS